MNSGMILFRYGSLLGLSLAIIAFQIVTPKRCFATEVSKTVELADPPAQMPESGKLPSALIALNEDNGFLSQYAFLVDKKTHTLSVWHIENGKVKAIAAFPADLGAKAGDKQRAGDLRTPEGIYFIQEALDGNKLDPDRYGEKIFTLDYPNTFDKLEKKTGNGIWLHAISDKKSLQRGSHGCVVVRNKTIEDLAKYIELKSTPLIVTEQVEYLSESEWLKAQKKFKELLPQDAKSALIFNEGKKVVAKIRDEDGTKILYALRGENGLEVVSEQAL